jgi:hypothetical protein
MSAGTGMGIDLTMVSTGAGNAQLPLGFIHTQPANQDGEGERTFIYIGTTASLAVNTAVERVDGTYDGLISTTGGAGAAEDDLMVGTLFNDMTDATLGVLAGTPRFGFAQRTGNGTALAAAAAVGAFGDTATTLGTAGDLAVAVLPVAVGENGVGTIISPSFQTVLVPPSGIFFLPVKLWCKG